MGIMSFCLLYYFEVLADQHSCMGSLFSELNFIYWTFAAILRLLPLLVSPVAMLCQLQKIHTASNFLSMKFVFFGIKWKSCHE